MSRPNYHPKKRGMRNRKTNRILLIAVEGGERKNKTELLYFQHFQKPGIVIRTAKGNDTNPNKMMKALIASAKEEHLDENDMAVCLVDADFQPQKKQQFNQAEQQVKEYKNSRKKDKTNIELILSAPSFEVWFLCHFRYSMKLYLSPDSVIDDLKHYIPNYEKSKDVFNDLYKQGNNDVEKGQEMSIKDAVEHAIKYARRLEDENKQAGRTPHTVDFSPSTEVYKIFEDFIYNDSVKQ